MKHITVAAFFVTLFSASVLLSQDNLYRQSHWSLSFEDESYALSLWRQGENIFIGYSFAYENGVRVNATIDADNYRIAAEISEGCYMSSVIDFIDRPEDEIEVILCERGNKLYWMLLSDIPPSFVPDFAVFEKYTF